MRVGRGVAWLLLTLGFLGAGLLRQFHDATLSSPYLPAVVGGLPFAAILLLLLVTAREHRLGAVGGRGIRIGSLTPILLMLLVEKWIVNSIEPWVFRALPPSTDPGLLNARSLAWSGVGLLVICLVLSRLSTPARRKVASWLRPRRAVTAVAATLAAGAAVYAVLGGLALAAGHTMDLRFPRLDRTWVWVVCGQGILALGEELYFRGLLLAEILRLAPRLGARRPAARRWTALVFTGVLFAIEHVVLQPGVPGALRRFAFTMSLGLLLGMLVLVTHSLILAAGVHATINWLLLGAVPRFTDAWGNPVPPSGTYVGLMLIFTFVFAFLVQRRERKAPVVLET